MLPVLYIVGCQRSGTTLLRSVLTAHPDLLIPPETSFFYWERTARPNGSLSDSELRELPDAFRASGASRLRSGHDMRAKLAQLGVDWGQVAARVAETDRRPVRVLEAMLVEWAQFQHDDGRRFGEKSPQHVFRIDRILENQPDARILQLVRDPRSVAASLRRMPWFRGGLVRAVEHWRDSVAAGAGAATRWGDAHVRTLRYEDLVNDPEGSLRTLCSFIDLPFSSEMLRHHEAKPVPAGHDDRDVAWKSQALRPIDPANLERWREELSDPEVEMIEWAVAGPARRLGYTPSSGSAWPSDSTGAPGLWQAQKRRENLSPQGMGRLARRLARRLGL